MARNNREPWYAFYGQRFAGQGPAFFDPADYPWAKTLEDNWTVIRDEILPFLERRESRLKEYFKRALMFPPRSWKTMGFYYWKYKIHQNCRDCPRTAAILESLPNMTAGSISVLEPNSNINPHHGDTDAIFRVHLGLVIPDGLPACGLQVGGEVRGWQEGKSLIFCDAHSHSSWNQSDRRRLVLIVDIVRPEFVARTDDVCSHVLASTFVEMAYQRFAWLNRLSGRLKLALYFAARLLSRAFLPLQRRAGFLTNGLSWTQ
jgi:aspartyl/asparaginyl beta-hydroxylase (cupin superfamily)